MAIQCIPVEWTVINAADSFDTISTSNKKIKSSEYKDTGKYPVIDQGQKYISGYIDDNRNVIMVTNPLVVFGDHTKVMKFIDFNFVPGADGTKVLDPKKFIDPTFFYYQLRNLNIPDKGYSRHFKFFKELNFVLPSTAEQKKIVDRLDILLAQVEATQARLARIPDIIKHFRQSVLSAASCGFTNGDVSYKKLNVLVDILNGARRPVSASKRNDIKGNIPYYGATGVVDYLDNYTHEGRFLLVGEDGANLLSKNKDLAFIIDGKSWVNNHAHVLKAKVDVSLDFIKIVINSLDLSPWVTGSAQPKLTKRALIELPVPFFSYKEQTEIVRRVEHLFTYADTIEQQAKAAKARVDNLTQAILAKAFRGELTADWRAANPDLISGDNSAAALLARIQAERATAKPRKRATKKTAA